MRRFGPGASRREANPLAAASIPCEGDLVKDGTGRSLRLGSELGTGGEGTVYEVSNTLACKVYRPDRFDVTTARKLELMTSKQVDHSSICWPVSLAYDAHRKPVGYLMPKARGKELMRSVFIPPLLRITFPVWTRRHLVELASTILDAVAHLHSLNVLIGDVNARNILVENESTVFFVDCDSYQIERFPCPVGMPPFVAPELYGKSGSLGSKLRTEENERFAIATLVFMLLHPGKAPYSHQGGEDPANNVQKRHFPYPLGGPGDRVPSGPWRFMWSHLPRWLKEEFHRVFCPDARPSDRQSVGEWQEFMRRYQSDLDKGYVYDEMFPKCFKVNNEDEARIHGIPWRFCEGCGAGFPAYDDSDTKCSACRSRLQGTSRQQQSTPPTRRLEREASVRPRPASPRSEISHQPNLYTAVRKLIAHFKGE